jgi:hypothetical protein
MTVKFGTDFDIVFKKFKNIRLFANLLSFSCVFYK